MTDYSKWNSCIRAGQDWPRPQPPSVQKETEARTWGEPVESDAVSGSHLGAGSLTPGHLLLLYPLLLHLVCFPCGQRRESRNTPESARAQHNSRLSETLKSGNVERRGFSTLSK